MSKEADRLIAEFLGETDHLKKWCSDAGAGKPLELCIEDPGETQRPDSCRHLAKGGCWNDCKSKATVDPPAYSTCDSAALEGLQSLPEHIDWEIYRIRHSPATGIIYRVVIQNGSKHGCWSANKYLCTAFEDAMVEEYCTGCKSVVCVPRPKELMKHRIKPAIERAMKGGSSE